MNWFKRKMYNQFAEQEIGNNKPLEANKGDISGTTKTSAPGDLTAAKKLSPKAKWRLAIWGSLGVIAITAISIILYDSLREKERVISKISTITKKDVKNFELAYTDNKETTTYTMAETTLVYSYLLSNSGDYKLFIPRQGNVPLTFKLNIQRDANGKWAVNGVGLNFNSEEKMADGSTPSDNVLFYDSILNPATSSNWSAEPSPFNWWALVSALLPLIIMVALGVMIFKNMNKMQGGGQDGIFSMGKSGAQLAVSNLKFSDVAGIKEEKEELSEIVDYLKNPQRYVAMGARTPKGVILYGPPGTGKTMLAKAVAGEAQVKFFQISGSQFEDMLVGVGAKRVRNLFADARKAAPAIIFIDEIDSVASKRGKNEFGGGLADQTINQLLAEMDGFNTSTGIVVIAATNRLDVLDDAILRPGRFDRHIQINLPDIKEREDILRIHARNKNISKKVSLYDIARRTPGFSGAQLENVLNEATLLSVRNKETMLTTVNIDEAIDRVIAGPAKKSRVITPNERKLIAYHEAGHAIVGLYTPGTDVVQKITIIPRGSAAGYTMQTPEGIEKRIQSKEDLLSMIRMTLGGRACEEVVFGKDQITTGASNDLYKITNVARAMVMQLGMSEIGMTQFFPSEGFVNPYQQQKLYSEERAQAIDAKIEEIIQTQYKNAKDIINKNRKELDLIVDTLLILETILKEDIDYIHKHKKLPQAAIDAKQLQDQELREKQIVSDAKVNVNTPVQPASISSDDEIPTTKLTAKPSPKKTTTTQPKVSKDDKLKTEDEQTDKSKSDGHKN